MSAPPANTANIPAMARPLGVVRSRASVSDTKPTPRRSSSWRVATKSARDRPPGIGIVQFAGVNEAHVQVAHLSALAGFIEQRIFAVQDGLLQCPLADIVIERGARFAQEQRQRFPVLQQVGDRLAQA